MELISKHTMHLDRRPNHSLDQPVATDNQSHRHVLFLPYLPFCLRDLRALRGSKPSSPIYHREPGAASGGGQNLRARTRFRQVAVRMDQRDEPIVFVSWVQFVVEKH
jgi:hypothetical protein